MFGQSLLSAFGSAVACTTDTNQLFATDVQTNSAATYQFNNATTSIPNNTYPGTAYNLNSYVTGQFGNAASFNGSNSYITTNYNVNFSNTPWTISFWMKSDIANDRYILGTNGMSISARSNGNLFLIGGGNTAITYSTGVWKHFVYTFDGSSTSKGYGNGVLEDTKSSSINSNSIPITFGRYGSNNAGYFDGAIDQVRIFNSELPQAAVTALYNETTTTATYPYITSEVANPNSVAYYKMSDATDQFGNYNGTASNVNFSTVGKFGFAGAFNGSSSYMQIPNNSFNYSTMTFSAWVNPSANGTYDYIFQNGMYDNRIGGSIGWYVRRESGGALLTRGFSANSLSVPEFDVTSASGLIPLNTWTNVVFVLTPTSFNIYLNGSSTAVASATFSNAITYSASQPAAVYIGANYYYYNANLFESFWEGKIDQIRIYDAALSAANLTTLYNEVECP